MTMAQTQPSGENPSPTRTIEQVFHAHESHLLRYALKLVQQREAAEDIVQEAFMRLHRHFETVLQPKPWLFRTVHNLAMNHHRASEKIVPMPSTGDDSNRPDPADPSPTPDERVQRMEEMGQAQIFLENLKPEDQRLIQLKFKQGLSYREMSEKTGISISNVGYRLHHVLKRLAREFKNRETAS